MNCALTINIKSVSSTKYLGLRSSMQDWKTVENILLRWKTVLVKAAAQLQCMFQVSWLLSLSHIWSYTYFTKPSDSKLFSWLAAWETHCLYILRSTWHATSTGIKNRCLLNLWGAGIVARAWFLWLQPTCLLGQLVQYSCLWKRTAKIDVLQKGWMKAPAYP